MASVCIVGDYPTDLDYSLVDGRVRSFTLKGKLLYDEDKNIAVEGWKDRLMEFIKEQDLHIDDGLGHYAFIYPLVEDGFLIVEDGLLK